MISLKSSEIFGQTMAMQLATIILVQVQHTQSNMLFINSITRDGKRGWMGNIKHKYKTVTRFYNQNFWDFYKMKLVDLILDQKKQ